MSNDEIRQPEEKEEVQFIELRLKMPASFLEQVRQAYHTLEHTRYGRSLDEPFLTDNQVRNTLYWICIQAIGDYINLPELERDLRDL